MVCDIVMETKIIVSQFVVMPTFLLNVNVHIGNINVMMDVWHDLTYVTEKLIVQINQMNYCVLEIRYRNIYSCFTKNQTIHTNVPKTEVSVAI